MNTFLIFIYQNISKGGSEKKMHFGKNVVPQFEVEVGAQQKKLVNFKQYYNDNHTIKIICYDTD